MKKNLLVLLSFSSSFFLLSRIYFARRAALARSLARRARKRDGDDSVIRHRQASRGFGRFSSSVACAFVDGVQVPDACERVPSDNARTLKRPTPVVAARRYCPGLIRSVVPQVPETRLTWFTFAG